MTFPDHVSGGDIERREQGRPAVALVVVRAALGRAERHRQNRSGPVEGLNLFLFVNAQDQGPIRRRQVESHDIAYLVDEERVARQLDRLTPMRLPAEGAPNAPDGGVTERKFFGQCPRALMGRVPRCFLQLSVITWSTCAVCHPRVGTHI
jgi:hypothetical protein